MKLARKLTIALILSLGLVLVVNAYVRVQREIGLFESDMRHDSGVMGRALGAAVLEIWRTDGEARALHMISQANESESGVRIRWVFVDAPAGDRMAPMAEPSSLAAVARGEALVRTVILDGGDDYLVTYIPVPAVADRVGALEFSESMASEHQYVSRTIVHALLTTGVIALVCALITMVLGVLFVGRPMRGLIEQARRIGAGDLSGRIELRQNDEIGELALEMNAMCERLAVATAKVESEVSARMAANEQLRHADRLATVGKLASGIAHELGTPLQVVSGRARMIRDGDLTGDEVPDSAGIILQQAERIARIIRQLLDFARRRRAEKVSVDLGTLVGQTLTLLSSIADKKQITLRREGVEVLTEARVDPEQIQQALMNLAVNAIDASRPRGAITLGVAIERIAPPADHGGPEANYICLSVEDEGVGMTEETMDHVFEPFFTTKQVGDGTGLGLSVTYGIIHEHGGFITVKSELGKGSRFSLYIPCEQA